MRKLGFWAVMALVGLWSASVAEADQIVLSANADTHVLSAVPNRNYGVAPNRVHTQTFSARRSLSNWDLSSAWSTIGTGTITSATVEFYLTGTSGVWQVDRVTQAWLEGTGDNTEPNDGATWNKYDGVNNWATAGGDYTTTGEASGSISGSGWFSFDITSIVQYWQSNENDTYGVIYGYTSPATPSATCFFREDTTDGLGARAAKLTINYTSGVIPEPGTMMLIGTGLLGVAGCIRRRRTR